MMKKFNKIYKTLKMLVKIIVAAKTLKAGAKYFLKRK